MRGLTLVEILVVMALMSILLGLGLLMGMEVYRGNLFRSTRDVYVSALTTARGRALANMYQSPEGVCYSAPNFIIFRGTTYSAAAATNDLILGNPGVSVSSASNFLTCGSGSGVVFSQLAGTTSATGLVTITETGHPNATVQLNSEGTILW